MFFTTDSSSLERKRNLDVSCNKYTLTKLTQTDIDISEYDYELPENRIAKFPLERREDSKLLVYDGGEIREQRFSELYRELARCSLLVFNNTKVVRARLIMHKPTGARIELFCLEPHRPADYERAFAVKREAEWSCIVGNSRRWKEGAVEVEFHYEGEPHKLEAYRVEGNGKGGEQIVRFEWSGNLTFGQLLEHLGKMPIPPYLGRESEDIDSSRYQTVYSKFEGSVAAPTAGLHFSEQMVGQLQADGVRSEEITLHVGAGTFLPVKGDDAMEHHMHTEHFEVRRSTIEQLISHFGNITAVGTTTVRTLESIVGLGYRIMQSGTPDAEQPIGQWELYAIPSSVGGRELLEAVLNYMKTNDLRSLKSATQIMITPGYRFRVVNRIITNFHQPRSTLLLLVSAFVGEDWRKIYRFALEHNFRFLSYGDSSILTP